MRVVQIGNVAFSESQIVSMTHDPTPGSEVTIVYLQGGVSHTFSGQDAVMLWSWYVTVNEVIKL